MLVYTEEQLMRYDVHGLELDWMREIVTFQDILREKAKIYAWRAAGPFPGDAQKIEINNDSLRSAKVSYAEIAVHI